MTKRLAELTTKIRSSNFTNLCPRTSGISRIMSLGSSCIGTSSGKESATSGAAISVTGASEMRMTRVKDATTLLIGEFWYGAFRYIHCRMAAEG